MEREPVAAIRSRLQNAPVQGLAALIHLHDSDDRAGVRQTVAAAQRRLERHLGELERLRLLYEREDALRAHGCIAIAGVDEVGRGALAGPLTAGACILPPRPHVVGLDDSKRLSPENRREIAAAVKEISLSWCVAHIDAERVDRLGVTEALKAAMRAALSGLELQPDHVIVDGLPVGIAANETAVVKGDSLVAAIAAASVIAKVERDDLMCALAADHPHYGFDVNKGYGTVEHLDAIERHGRSPVHRVSFCPGRGTDRLF